MKILVTKLKLFCCKIKSNLYRWPNHLWSDICVIFSFFSLWNYILCAYADRFTWSNNTFSLNAFCNCMVFHYVIVYGRIKSIKTWGVKLPIRNSQFQKLQNIHSNYRYQSKYKNLFSPYQHFTELHLFRRLKMIIYQTQINWKQEGKTQK